MLSAMNGSTTRTLHVRWTLLQTFRGIITRQEFISRRQLLVEKVRSDISEVERQRPVVIVAAAAHQTYSGPDVPYPYRQSSYFRYLTGLPVSKTLLTVIDCPKQPPLSTLYYSERTEREQLWEGPGLSRDELQAISGVDEVRNIEHLEEDLEKLNPVVSCCEIGQLDHSNSVSKVFSSCSTRLLPLREYVDKLRWIKSEAEIELMRKTCEIGSRAMNEMVANCCDIRNENEVVGRLEFEVRRRNASCLAYPPVVAGGRRANIIHYLDANQRLDKGDTVLVDAGCEYEGYVSDISRVFPVSGEFTPAQAALYDGLLAVHETLIKIAETVRPLTLNYLYITMVEEMARVFNELNMFSQRLTEQQLLSEIESLCPHHVSHYLGMDVHDTASITRNIPLLPGVVFTIEPGVYVREDNEIIKKEFRGLGMRIEDDFLATESGCKMLTELCLKKRCDIERLMSG